MRLSDRLLYSKTLRRVSDFIDEHWVVRWFVLPILFMGLLVLGMAYPIYGAVPALELVGVFLAVCYAVVLAGLLVGRVVGGVVKRRRA
ncbi:hypothetical protein ACFO0N_04755 [Halobium salinum]|uniref:Uncharacterized protein n=1 Tax=Halobium salinum TaxID=1364940 RepID=A0ABD5P971_9EURY|nr:hypothetical protein [Halobium salinum]